MNIEDMTPEQLREYAAAKEERRAALETRYISDAPTSAEAVLNKGEVASVAEAQDKVVLVTPNQHEPYMQPIEFEGETYWIDNRKVYSQTFILKLAKVRRKIDKEGEADVLDMVELFDFIMGNENDHITEVATKAKGFDDFREIYRIKEAIFDELDIKN